MQCGVSQVLANYCNQLIHCFCGHAFQLPMQKRMCFSITNSPKKVIFWIYLYFFKLSCWGSWNCQIVLNSIFNVVLLSEAIIWMASCNPKADDGIEDGKRRKIWRYSIPWKKFISRIQWTFIVYRRNKRKQLFLNVPTAPIVSASRKHAFIIVTPINPTFI